MKPSRIVLLIALFASAVSLQAQTPPQNFDEWVNALVVQVMNSGHNGKGSDRQKESPSTDTRSTSLVDQSSATDFFSMAMNVVPVTPGLSQFTSGGSSSNSGAAGSGTATVSLSALLAAISKTSPTDPTFYKNHVNARRLSFTVGTAASTIATDNTDQPAVVYGTKLLLINHREVYAKINRDRIKNVQKSTSLRSVAIRQLKIDIQQLIFKGSHPGTVLPDGTVDKLQLDAFLATSAFSDNEFGKTVASMSKATAKEITDLITSSLDAFEKFNDTVRNEYDEISKGMELSLSYTANIRDSKGNNLHRAQLIFDYGLSQRINWTFNASGDYTDRKAAEDSKGGRAATEFQYKLTKSNSAWGRLPMQFGFSGEAQWLTKQKPQYTFQTKLSIPVIPGIELPLVYRYANRTAQLNQKNSEARFGFSIDVSRIAKGMQ